MSAWLINGYSPEALGLAVAGFSFQSGGPSSVTLSRSDAFDASQHWNEGDAVSITRDGAAFFKGKLTQVGKSGTGTSEGQDYLIEDAFAELERTTYQEPWFIRQSDYTGMAYSPRVILGVNSSGTRITVSEQITEVIEFAASVGIDIQAGSFPTGMLLWPTEASGMSCAEVIRTTLRYYPDWIPWIDHSTTPPTFNVTPRSSATARTVSCIGCVEVEVTKDAQRVPDGVRIVYETAAMFGEEVVRTYTIDQAPAPTGTAEEIVAALVAPAGPGMLVAPVELQGMQMPIQKQQIVTRTIPEDSSGAVAYLKKKFPAIAAIDDAKITVSDWARELLAETDEEVDPIDSKMERMVATSLTHTPRELVRGNIAEWMRKRVGQVRITFTLAAGASATADEKARLAKIPTEFTVKGTNAVTKIYQGVSGYQAGEEAPTGVAAAYLATIQGGCNYSGSITIKETDIGAVPYHGCKLHISGGVGAWATMGAPIHSVTSDLESRETTIGFGPNPDYAIQDYLEFLRLLSKRRHINYTTEERTSETLGSSTTVSARGDSVGPFDQPESTPGGGAAAAELVGAFYGLVIGSDGHTYLQGGSVTGGTGVETAANIKIIDSGTGPTQAAGTHMYVIATGDGITADGVLLPGWNLTNATIGYAATVPDNTLPTASSSTGKLCHVDLGVFTADGFLPAAAGNIQISHCLGSYAVSRDA